MFLKFPLVLLCLIVAGVTVQAAERSAFKPPLQRQLESLVLPEARFRDADLSGALRYLSQKAAQQSGGKIRVPFSLDLPEDFEARYELTLDVRRLPFLEALRYLGEQARVEFAFEGSSIVVRKLGTKSARQPVASDRKPAPAPPGPQKGLAGVLAEPAKPSSVGGNVHRTTAGVVQAEKSGYVPRRGLGGWSTTIDPRHRVGVNCVRISACPAGACGCHLCACKRDPRPSP